ncbi:MAG: hypothetical protein QM809_04160 [Gordonia sp. (in: high G+C Gram-positive bacteria)]|uniref:hypothetical protein n=1 Tax=Gordonia sp. (in: high G+C Gram-positive bacteria) TaxID=84139 RepID=UPI0039E3CBD3
MNEHATPTPGPDPYPPTETTAPEKRRRPILVGAAIGAAVLLIGGAGAAIALSVSSDEEPTSVSRSVDADDRTDADDRDDDDAERRDAVPGRAVPSDSGALVKAVDAAVAAVPGATGATAITVDHDGWEVDVARSGAADATVVVALDGGTRTRDDDGDRDGNPVLDTSRIGALVDAALAEAGRGTVASISTENGRNHHYEVTVDLGDGSETEVRLTRDLAVVSVERDE